MEFSNVYNAAWGDVVDAIAVCYDWGWTDGLPVVPPPVEREAVSQSAVTA